MTDTACMMMKISLSRLAIFMALAFVCSGLQAREYPVAQLPDALVSWVDWVLFDHTDRNCPFVYNTKQRYCLWPTELELDISRQGGQFSQHWVTYQQTKLALPGDRRSWPQKVLVNDVPAVVMDDGGQPYLLLDAGSYAIKGRFYWDAIPETVSIPENTGLITLRIAGKTVALPDIDEQGRVWLRNIDKQATLESERLDLNVFRKIVDDIPLQVITQIDMDVAGQQREVSINNLLLEGAIPLALSSRLPARLEQDGVLRMQVRPGRWSLQLISRFPHDITQLALTTVPQLTSATWPAQEVWSFEARNALRLVDVQGVPSIDPRQTKMPAQWQQLPAFQLKPGDIMRFNVKRRGDPDPEPDKLTLERDLWLDFDGGGYTFKDNISGTMTKGWRLEAAPAFALGHVSIDGKSQFITTLPGTERKGVEVRRGNINLQAEGRYEDSIYNIPAIAWGQDFTRVSTVLNLPPGWRLFYAAGVDNVPNTWLQRWTLLDLFLVLIAGLSLMKLWNWRWGLVGLISLALIWHEAGAPQMIFLTILALIALLRVFPEVGPDQNSAKKSGQSSELSQDQAADQDAGQNAAGHIHSKSRLRRILLMGKYMALLILVLNAVPFMVEQVRVGLYPQLERYFQLNATRTTARLDRELAPSMDQAVMEAGKMLQSVSPASQSMKFIESYTQRELEPDFYSRMVDIDPDAVVQTGPGLPQWQWLSIPLSWNGPVEKAQQIKLILLSPTVNMLLNFIRAGVMIGFILLFFGVVGRRASAHGEGSEQSASIFMTIKLAFLRRRS